jgi:hypothetical protein
MVRRVMPLALSIAAAVCGTGFPVLALASPSKQQCVDDNAEAQELRRHGRFADASERLNRCAVEACPAIVTDDCTRRLDDLKKAQPSLIFEVRSLTGADIISVRVAVDGRLLADHLDGTPLNVDPGAHVFTFEIPGQPPVTRHLLVREGEAARHEPVVIGGPSLSPTPVAATAPIVPARPLMPAGQDGGLSTRQVVGLSTAGLGAVGAVVGTIFGVKARSAWNEVKVICGGDPGRCVDAPSASPHRSQALSDGTVSTVAFVAGAALIAGGAFLYLTGGEHHEGKSQGVSVSAAVDAGRVGVVLLGQF